MGRRKRGKRTLYVSVRKKKKSSLGSLRSREVEEVKSMTRAVVFLKSDPFKAHPLWDSEGALDFMDPRTSTEVRDAHLKEKEERQAPEAPRSSSQTSKDANARRREWNDLLEQKKESVLRACRKLATRGTREITEVQWYTNQLMIFERTDPSPPGCKHNACQAHLKCQREGGKDP